MQVRHRKQQPGIEFDPPEFSSVQPLKPKGDADKERIRELVEEFKPLAKDDPEFIPAMQGVLEDEGFSDEMIAAIVAELEEHSVTEESPRGWDKIQV